VNLPPLKAASWPNASHKIFYLPLVWLLLAAFWATPVHATLTTEALLSRDTAPPGVVIEIVEGNEAALATLLPKVRLFIQQLQQKFPGTPVALVSHGGEQFALQSRLQSQYADIHAQVQSLVDDEIPVHVCGTHAGWYDVLPQDFPDYIAVSRSGPAQIRRYQAQGYELLLLRE